MRTHDGGHFELNLATGPRETWPMTLAIAQMKGVDCPGLDGCQ